MDFEKPLIDLEKQIRDLESLAEAGHPEIGEQIDKLKRIADKKRRETYENLNRWERVQLARHPLRPYSLDYVKMIASDFTELHGDRLFSEDKAIVGGLAVIEGHKVAPIMHNSITYTECWCSDITRAVLEIVSIFGPGHWRTNVYMNITGT